MSSSTPPDPSSRSPEDVTGPGRPARRWHPRLLAALATILVAVVAVAVLAGGGDRKTSDRPTSATAGPTAAPPTPTALRPYTLGSERAPLHLVEYADFQCPYCLQMLDPDAVDVLDRWIASGRLRFTWRDFAKLGPESVLAAHAGRAAARQGAFWEMYGELFQAAARDRLDTSSAALTTLARRAGVRDLARFRRDLRSASTRRFVARSAEVSAHRGIDVVPTFVANGRRVRSGSMDASQLDGLLRRLWADVASGDEAPAIAPSTGSASSR